MQKDWSKALAGSVLLFKTSSFGALVLTLSLFFGCATAALDQRAVTNTPPSPITVGTPVAEPTTATPTPKFTVMPTPRNDEIAKLIEAMPQSSPLSQPPVNSMGLIPGKTTKTELVERFGEPQQKSPFDGAEYWDYHGPILPGVRGIIIEGELVSEISFSENELISVESVVEEFGPPQLVGYLPSPDTTDPHARDNAGVLVYPALGLQFQFDCSRAVEPCDGVPRVGFVYERTHFKPMSVTEWMESHWVEHESKTGRFYIRPWNGFVD